MVVKVLAVILYILVCAWCYCAGYLCCDKFNSKTFEDGMKAFDDALQSLYEAQDLLRQADDRYSEAAKLKEDARTLYNKYKKLKYGGDGDA